MTDPDPAAEPQERRGGGGSRALVAAWAVVLSVIGGLLLWGGLSPNPGGAPAAVTMDLPARPRAGENPVPAPAPPAVATAPVPVPPPAPPPPGDSTPAWVRYRSAFDGADPRPRVAVVLTGLGLSVARTEAAIALSGGVTLAFSVYADNLERWVGLARARGHEALIAMPMEPANVAAFDPGPRALLTSLPPAENQARLDWALRRAVGVVGIVNELGDRFTAVETALRPLLDDVKARGLVFVDARTSSRSRVAKIATEIGLPRAIVDRVVDEEPSREAIDMRLAEVVAAARRNGVAVALGSPYPVTLERLAAWTPGLEVEGVVLAPVSAVINLQQDR